MKSNQSKRIYFLLIFIHGAFFQTSEGFSQSSLGRASNGISATDPSASIRMQQQAEAIEQFCSKIDTILQSDNPHETFLSFTLKGIKAPRKTKNMSESKRSQIEKEKENLRGKIREVHGRLLLLKTKTGNKTNSNDNLFVQTTTKYHGATDVAQNFKLCEFRLKDVMCLSSSSKPSAISLPLSEWGNVDDLQCSPFLSGEVETVDGSWLLDLTKRSKGQMCKFVQKKNNVKTSSMTLTHDKPKNFVLSPSSLFFQKLGITDEQGKPKVARSSKLRQCQKFVEIVSRLVETSNIVAAANKSSHLKIVDMGCGRGYLTFALHHYLYEKYSDLDIESIGVDVRPKLMSEVNSIARDLGEKFNGLLFTTGTIENAEIDGDIDVLIALHACDTATDDAISYGINKNSTIIVTAPCCHKQVRMYLDAHVANAKGHPYADVLRHNIYKERLAETITDSIRALLLEIAGYDVQVFEFIGGEHTSKNVMITAVKRSKPRTELQIQNLRERLNAIAELHGIKRQKLAVLMGESLGSVDKSNIKRNGMPGLFI